MREAVPVPTSFSFSLFSPVPDFAAPELASHKLRVTGMTTARATLAGRPLCAAASAVGGCGGCAREHRVVPTIIATYSSCPNRGVAEAHACISSGGDADRWTVTSVVQRVARAPEKNSASWHARTGFPDAHRIHYQCPPKSQLHPSPNPC